MKEYLSCGTFFFKLRFIAVCPDECLVMIRSVMGGCMCMYTHVRLGRETGPVCVAEAGSVGGLARESSADDTCHACLFRGASEAFSLGALPQA